MARWETHQTDGNAQEIYAAAKKLGFSVVKLNRPVDALWGIYDQTVAVEIKQPKGKLEPAQVKFFRDFRGMTRVIRTVDDAIRLHRDLFDRAEALKVVPFAETQAIRDDVNAGTTPCQALGKPRMRNPRYHEAKRRASEDD